MSQQWEEVKLSAESWHASPSRKLKSQHAPPCAFFSIQASFQTFFSLERICLQCPITQDHVHTVTVSRVDNFDQLCSTMVTELFGSCLRNYEILEDYAITKP